MRIKVIIVDDEPRAHKILESYISRIPEIDLSGTFLTAIEALNFIRQNDVDLVFLDITMPEVDGFAFLRMLNKPIHVIFTTAHAEFALESYDYNATDYLKKPIAFQRFVKAINKVSNLMTSHGNDKPMTDHIDLRIDGEVKSLLFNHIKYFQSLGNYIKVITDDKTYLTQITTKDVEDCLPKELFIRIHKSFIVNKAKIERVIEDEVTIGTVKLPIGKTFKKYVKDAVK